ncbi:MAG: TerB family tellurite resistance protein [Cyanobacteria bacterium J06581_3]
MQLLRKRPAKADSAVNTADSLQEQLEEKIFGLFGQVVKDRANYYEAHPDELPTAESLPTLTKYCANQNAGISGGASLVPGPLGMLVVIPEIVLIIKNQVEMVYDIGVAYGYKKQLSPELLASVVGYALGAGTLGLLALHGQKVLVKRASLRLMQKLVKLMAGKVSQRLLKSMVGKWVPLAGAVALAAWSKYSTHAVAKKAISIFEKELEFDNDEVGIEAYVEDEESLETTDSLDTQVESRIEKTKIKSLINLMRIDGDIKPEEQEFIGSVIEDSSVPGAEKLELIENMNQSDKLQVDYSEIKKSPEDAVSLIIDLVALSKQDGDFHISEKMYIKQVG